MVASMMRTSNPASSSGVEIARSPNGAVASILENDGTKKTIFLDFFTQALRIRDIQPSTEQVCRTPHQRLSKTCHDTAKTSHRAPALETRNCLQDLDRPLTPCPRRWTKLVSTD